MKFKSQKSKAETSEAEIKRKLEEAIKASIVLTSSIGT